MSTVEFKGSLHFLETLFRERTSPGSGDGWLTLNPLPSPDYLCDLGPIALSLLCLIFLISKPEKTITSNFPHL